MSVTNAFTRGLAPRAAAVGLAALACAAAGLARPPIAQAAAVSRTGTPAALHVAGTSASLPGTSTFNAFSEAPDGDVYYANGSSVYVVKHTSVSLVMKLRRKVLAVAANSTDLFVESGRTVTEYNSADAAVRSWTLSSPHVPTAAGLYAVGTRLWAWADYSTDQSGLQYANVYRFATSSASVHAVSVADAYPGEMAADSDGAYYQEIGKHLSSYLVRVTSAGASRRVKYSSISLEITLFGGRVELLAYHVSHGKSSLYLDSYSQSNLAHKYSRSVSMSVRDIAGTGAGLLLLSSSCTSVACSSAKVAQISSRTGATLSTLRLRDAVGLIAGPSAAALTYHGGDYHLVRLAS
jgi:hypothetical protein